MLSRLFSCWFRRTTQPVSEIVKQHEAAKERMAAQLEKDIQEHERIKNLIDNF